jgi:hypothetical protein
MDFPDTKQGELTTRVRRSIVVFVEQLIFSVRKFSLLLKPKVHLPCSQEVACGPCTEPVEGRTIAQVVSRRLPTAAARVRAQVRSCGICGAQSGTGQVFSDYVDFPSQFSFH